MSRRAHEVHVSRSEARKTPKPSPSPSSPRLTNLHRYKGMAVAHPAGAASRTPTKVTPQSTGGFSQVGGRPGGSNEPAAAAMSVLLSWHEKVVELAGLGCITRTMTDWRRV